MVIVGGLQRYITDEKEKDFHSYCRSKLMKENRNLEKTETKEVGRNLDVSFEGLDTGGLELKLTDILGDVELGKLTEEYYVDADLRELLSLAVLDTDKMTPLEGHNLCLVTAVMYSAKFFLKGNRMHQEYKEMVAKNQRKRYEELGWGAIFSGDVHTPSKFASLLGSDSFLKGSVKKQSFLPPMVRRHSRAPFLFKFCRVAYNKEGKRLQIDDGEFVGKQFRSRGGYEDKPAPVHSVISDEDAAIHLEMEESLTPGGIFLTKKDDEKVEEVRKLLITAENGTQLKTLILTYLNWFEHILTSDSKQLLLDKPLTKDDCDFLQKLGIRARPKQLFLRLASVQRDVIHEYGCLFKFISEASQENWEELLQRIVESGEGEKKSEDIAAAEQK
ncbi:hypothetical protein AWC38_SpisGene16707 [Stylophora pistillata]|uniref:Uncharacterized protein n=1 Tax=Stylophora pistillata TaxID=50429 RepID=A0A2B4RP03_STYPI|nr:hypothetical protein AWC38_SpisGene16707 [Stylophora pistillata]